MPSSASRSASHALDPTTTSILLFIASWSASPNTATTGGEGRAPLLETELAATLGVQVVLVGEMRASTGHLPVLLVWELRPLTDSDDPRNHLHQQRMPKSKMTQVTNPPTLPLVGV